MIDAVSAAPSLGSAPPLLFSDRGCPFAHRVLALLTHLEAPSERHEAQVGEKPPGIHRYAKSAPIPMLVHGDLVLTESRVMLEHLAEHHGMSDAYPPDLAERTAHRHAMAVVDERLVPLLMERAPVAPDDPRLHDALRALEAAVATTAPRPCLLVLHVAPIWLRFRLWQPEGVVTRAIEARPTLCAWLDEAVELECVARTAPDPVTHLEDLARAREAGLLSPARS